MSSPDPTTPAPRRKRRKLPVFLSDDECNALLAAAPGPRDRLIILLGLYLGLRVSEIVGLRVERIDWSRRQLLVYQGKGGKDRFLPIHQRVTEPLQAWIGARAEGWVFASPKSADRPLTARCVQYMVEKAAARAGIRRPDPSQRMSPHKLRHTFASRLIARGADIAAVRDLLGHASVSTTQVYLHCDSGRLRQEIDRL